MSCPRRNWYGPTAYRQKLQGAGFHQIEIRSIREQVYGPAFRFAARGFGLASAWVAAMGRFTDALDYLLVRAIRPR